MSKAVVYELAAALPVHMGNAVTGEAPYWDERRRTLWWIDIEGQRLLGFEPGTGRARDHRLPLMPGLIAGSASGGLLLGLEDGLYAFDPATGLGGRQVAVEADNPSSRLNDGKPDAKGRLWFGSMDKSGRGAPVGTLYCRDLDGSVRVQRSGVHVPNSIAFSPDGRTLYFADSRTKKVECCDYDCETGRPGSWREFVAYADGESPDGACTDAAGGVWIAVIGGGRIERRLPDGSLSLIVHLPVSRPTMPMLGGPDGKTLFVTSQRCNLSGVQLAQQPLAGHLLAVRVDIPAAPVNLVP